VPVKHYAKDRKKHLCIHNGIYMEAKSKMRSLAAENTCIQASERSPSASPFPEDGVIIIINNNSDGNRRNTASKEHWS